MGMLMIMDVSGHRQLGWAEQDTTETGVAAQEFARALFNGSVAYGFHTGERVGNVIREFDPAADRIVIRPQAAGG